MVGEGEKARMLMRSMGRRPGGIGLVSKAYARQVVLCSTLG